MVRSIETNCEPESEVTGVMEVSVVIGDILTSAELATIVAQGNSTIFTFRPICEAAACTISATFSLSADSEFQTSSISMLPILSAYFDFARAALALSRLNSKSNTGTKPSRLEGITLFFCSESGRIVSQTVA